MKRVLAPGGTAVVSVPFCFYLHGRPHDYFRFTRYGLSHLAQEAQSEVIGTASSGGLPHLVLNVVSVALSVTMWGLGAFSMIPCVTRLFLAISQVLSSRLESTELFPMNYIFVLRRNLDRGTC